jgi:hypothetical protein
MAFVTTSLLMGLKDVLLVQGTSSLYDRPTPVKAGLLDTFRRDAALKILMMLQNEWQGIGRAYAL